MNKYKDLKQYVVKIIEGNSNYGVKRIKKALIDDYRILAERDQFAKLLILWGLGLKRNIKKKEISMIPKFLLALASSANLLIRAKVTAPL